MFLVVGRWSTLSRMGSEIFSALGGFGIFYALLTGPLATVDCLSRERREGTLGLLFLTDVKGYDVVLGKMVAASFHMVLGLTAALPLLALPLLVGGINLAQFARLALAIADITMLSLAVGVLASALMDSSRGALALTLAILLLLCVGLPLLGEAVFKIHGNGVGAALFYSACPLYTAGLCLDLPLREPLWKYWINLGCLHGLAWACLAIACIWTAKSWRDQPVSTRLARWTERVRAWRRGSVRARSKWRERMLEKNPIAWLEGRDRLQERTLWCLFLLTATYCTLRHLHSPKTWPNEESMVLWPWWAHFVLCIWLGVQAPRRLADDKHSGALELMLCTPLSARAMVRGNMSALRGRYGPVLLALAGLDGFLVFAYFRVHGGWPGLLHNSLLQLFVWAAVICPIQLYAIARLGIYHGLKEANSIRATFASLWRVGLLPWILFFAFILVCDFYASRFRVLRPTETLVYAAWGLCHLLPLTWFVANSHWHLSRDFRTLAASGTRVAWYRRLGDLARKLAFLRQAKPELRPV